MRSTFSRFYFPAVEWAFRIKKDCIAIFILIVIFSALFYPILFEGKTFFFRDLVHFGYPFKHYIWKSWQEGVLPFWNPQISGGVPFLSLYLPGIFYPPNLVFLWNDFGTAFNLFYLLHHIVLTLSVYRLTRFWGLSPEASMGSTVAVLLGGYFLSLSSVYNHFQATVWFPLLLLSFNRLILNKRFSDFFVTVLCFTFMFLAGSPETCIFAAGIIGVYGVFIVPREPSGTSIFFRATLFSGAVILSLALSAIQLVPTGALMKESTRSKGMSFEESSRMSLSPSGLSALILPENHFGFMQAKKVHRQYFLQSYFMGLFPLSLLLAGLFSGMKTRAFCFWSTLFLMGIFFSMGRYNPVYAMFYDEVPFLSLFRFPEKFFFLSAFSLVFLVGMGLDALGSINRGENIRSVPSLLAVLSLLVFLIWVAVIEPDRDWITGVLTLMVLAVLLFLASSVKKGVAMFKVFAVAFLVMELWVRNVSLLPMVDRSFYEKSPGLIGKLEKHLYRVYAGKLLIDGDLPTANQFPARKNLMASHIAMKDLLRPNLGTIFGLSYADGLTGLELKTGWLWTELFIKSPPEKRIRMLQRSNVRYWIKDNHESGNGAQDIEQFPSALPRAYLVNAGQTGRSPHLLNTYYDSAFDPLNEVLLNEKINWMRKEGFEGRVESIEYGPNRVSVVTDQNSKGMLVLLDTFFPGWRVEVDGSPDRILRANYFYRGVRLDAGRHVVEFSYIPEGFRTGLRISFLALVILLVGPMFYHFRNSK